MLQRLLAMLRKEYLQFFRDRALIYIVLYLFTVEIYVAGSGFNIEVRNYPTAIYDRDNTQLSVQLAEKFRLPYFRVTHLIYSDSEMVTLLNKGTVSLVLVIPYGFARDLVEKNHAEVQAIADGTLSNTALLALGYASQIAGEFAQEVGRRLGRTVPGAEHLQPQVKLKPRVKYNPNQKAEWFSSLMELFSVITVVSILLPAAAMVREKERGTIEQLMVTPITPVEIMLAKVISMASIVLVSSFLSLFLVIYPIFALPWRGNMLLYMVATALFVFSATGVGLLIATVCRNLPQTILFLLIVLPPIMFLSGSWTALEAMPLGMRLITYISPLKYYIIIAYGILLKGAGLTQLWPEFVGLIVLGLLLFGFCAVRFRRHFG
ncbi:MAG: ABC transporter permease [Deltaproteobacteria bacterium]|nr:ABC transporter permease [Deltaproteobacteria bacterium]MBW1985724.1 ABC transporter permease [Deltaproteobacteria bacterium]